MSNFWNIFTQRNEYYAADVHKEGIYQNWLTLLRLCHRRVFAPLPFFFCIRERCVSWIFSIISGLSRHLFASLLCNEWRENILLFVNYIMKQADIHILSPICALFWFVFLVRKCLVLNWYKTLLWYMQKYILNRNFYTRIHYAQLTRGGNCRTEAVDWCSYFARISCARRVYLRHKPAITSLYEYGTLGNYP